MMIFLLKFVFVLNWAKCVEFPLPTVLLVDLQPRRAHYFAKQSIVCYTYGISGTRYTIKQGSRKNLRSKDFLGKWATSQKPAPPKGGADKRANCDAVGYTLLNGCLFCSAFSSKFFPVTAGNIDCNLSFFYLLKDDKKAADIFSITDLKHKY